MPSWGVFWRHIIQQRKTSNVLADVCLRGCSPLTSAAWKVKHIWAVPRPLTLLQLHYICLQLREEHLVLHGPEVMSSLCLTNHSKKSEASGDHRPITLFPSLDTTARIPRRDVPYFCPFWLSVMGSITHRGNHLQRLHGRLWTGKNPRGLTTDKKRRAALPQNMPCRALAFICLENNLHSPVSLPQLGL